MWHPKNWPTSPKVAPESYYEMEINFRPFVTFCNYSLFPPTLAQVFAPGLNGLNGPPKLATPFENGRKDTALKSPPTFSSYYIPQIWQPFPFSSPHQWLLDWKHIILSDRKVPGNFGDPAKFRTLNRAFQKSLIGTFFSKPNRVSSGFKFQIHIVPITLPDYSRRLDHKQSHSFGFCNQQKNRRSTLYHFLTSYFMWVGISSQIQNWQKTHRLGTS